MTKFQEDEHMEAVSTMINLSVRRDQLLSQLRLAQINPSKMDEARRVADNIAMLPRAPEYKAASDTLGNGIPPWFIGCLHYREDTGQSLRSYLGNGELIIGTGRKTSIVPKLRGPFATFHEGAVDAMNLEFKGTTQWQDLGNCLVRAEMYNGEGYAMMGVVNPYLFAGTSIYHSGKYSYDGHYDPNLVDQELGIVCIMKALGIV